MSITPETDRLRATLELWRSNQDRLPPAVDVQGGRVDTSSLFEAMSRALDLVELSETGSVEPVAKVVHWPGVVNQITSLQNTLQTALGSGNPQAIFQQQAQNFVSALWGLRSALYWVLPFPEAEKLDTTHPQLSELVASADRVFDLRRRAGEAERELQAKLAALGQQSENATNLLTKIEGFERTAGNARESAEASSSAAKVAAESIDTLLSRQSGSSAELQELLAEFQRKRTFVDETLEGASKVALANAFQQRRKSLSWERWGWVIGFILGIASLVLVGAYVAPKVLGDITLQGQAKYWEVVGHFLILGPIVWATWFAARKAGQTMRLAEDYAFKEAAAHSFVGYKREMADDAEMLSQLRQYAIRNFGADPLRVLSDDEAASPLHDAMNKLLERIDKLKPEEAMKALGELARALGQATGAK